MSIEFDEACRSIAELAGLTDGSSELVYEAMSDKDQAEPTITAKEFCLLFSVIFPYGKNMLFRYFRLRRMLRGTQPTAKGKSMGLVTVLIVKGRHPSFRIKASKATAIAASINVHTLAEDLLGNKDTKRLAKRASAARERRARSKIINTQ